MPYTSTSQSCRKDGSAAMETMLTVLPDIVGRHWTAPILWESLKDAVPHSFPRTSLAVFPTWTDML